MGKMKCSFKEFNLEDEIRKSVKRNPNDVERGLSIFANEYIESLGLRVDGDRPCWEEAFMLMAYEAARRSSCRYIYAGAVIVKDKRAIALGYNGAPTNIENCLDRGCRKDGLEIEQDKKRTGNCRGAHAERNAMDQIARKELKGSALYTVLFPCSDCAKTIVGNQIREVYYSKAYNESDSLTVELFREAKIKLKRIHPNLEKHYLELKRIDCQGRD